MGKNTQGKVKKSRIFFTDLRHKVASAVFKCIKGFVTFGSDSSQGGVFSDSVLKLAVL